MISEEEFNNNYKDRVIYFNVVKNPRNNFSYSIQFTTIKDFDYYTYTKYILVDTLPGIRFNKYKSFTKRYWDYYNKYCKKHNDNSKLTGSAR